ncbi:UDP-Glycosyltransferase/glycogen phosphorylase [Hesseltinella vesiculosa]|uniref:GDP-Man:Man(3)GlcNAc(2)-PP-Dol alpha-1,2-mannosyltransferase n=1 Tax=Hesseltinella vesiculosa TaxID=101127 RepID=A0A1X2G8M1_9FUNG|nr:UDP-Glycosyltransferase/glycogen phosphorylase [Hesseltinella vesiculosa]
MLQRVYERRTQYNNDRRLADSWIWTTGKLIYYRMFARVYGFCGSFSQTVMVNSTWTKNHIDQLWSTDANIVYPPCDTDRLSDLPLDGRQTMIVSIAQFRPEKDHRMQVLALARLLEKYPEWQQNEKLKLVLIGTCRNQGDQGRIDDLKALAKELRLDDRVCFEVNASYDTLVSYLSKAKVGLHTMWNEHFGIGVVEYQTAGLIAVAHCSGGPKHDIVVNYANKPTGFLADSVETFADRLHDALTLSDEEYKEIASNARASASDRFSELAFSVELLRPLRQCLT